MPGADVNAQNANLLLFPVTCARLSNLRAQLAAGGHLSFIWALINYSLQSLENGNYHWLIYGDGII
jgi:hypothetical protein